MGFLFVNLIRRLFEFPLQSYQLLTHDCDLQFEIPIQMIIAEKAGSLLRNMIIFIIECT